MKQAVIDTDTLSYIFRKHPAVIERMTAYIQEHGFLTISVVTYYEVLNGLYFKDAKGQLEKFEALVEASEVLELTEEIAKKAASIYADLRKQGKSIGHNDVMIASAAIVHKMCLITNNTEHFSRIEGLEIENWAIQ